MPELFRGATWLSQSNGPFFLSVRLGCRLLCTYLVALGEDSFGVYWFIWGARRWLAVTAGSLECWGATGSGGLSVGRAGAFPLCTSCSPSSSPGPELGPGSCVLTIRPTRWKGLRGSGQPHQPLCLLLSPSLGVTAEATAGAESYSQPD